MCEILIISLGSVVLSLAYYVMMGPDELLDFIPTSFDWFFDQIKRLFYSEEYNDRFSPISDWNNKMSWFSKIKKPLYKCEKCTAAWMAIISHLLVSNSIVNIRHLIIIYSISLTIILTKYLSWLLPE